MTKITKQNFITDDKTDFVFVSSLIDKTSGDLDSITSKELLKKLKDLFPSLELLYNTRDVWCRDYMPVQLTEDIYLSYIYKPDYLQKYPNCVTNWRINKVKTKNYVVGNKLKTVVEIPLILDGGNIIKAVVNEEPAILMCDKVLVENNIDKEEFLEWWRNWWDKNFSGTKMGCYLIPWEGKKDNPIGHADGIIRYMGDGNFLFTNYHDLDRAFAKTHGIRYDDKSNENYSNNIINALTTREYIKNEDFTPIKTSSIHTLSYWEELESLWENDANFRTLFDNSWSYINYLQIGNKIWVPELGIPELDNLALTRIREKFLEIGKDFQIDTIGINMLPIIAGNGNNNSGGALNCLTWTIKKDF